jgi:hypothetical protein
MNQFWYTWILGRVHRVTKGCALLGRVRCALADRNLGPFALRANGMQFPWRYAPPKLPPARLGAQNLASFAQDLNYEDA